jgi:hypothetical protein
MEYMVYAAKYLGNIERERERERETERDGVRILDAERVRQWRGYLVKLTSGVQYVNMPTYVAGSWRSFSG